MQPYHPSDSTCKYVSAPGVQHLFLQNRPVLTTAGGGRIALDRVLLALWDQADGRSLEQVIKTFRPGFPIPNGGPHPLAVRAGLACLAEAGLLDRKEAVPPAMRELQGKAGPGHPQQELVSVIVVSFNSRPWLEACLPSLLAQTYAPLEIILVDNGSSDDSAAWTARKFPQVRLLQIEDTVPFAEAINRGAALAQGVYFFILNPDVELDPQAILRLVETCRSSPKCGAVAAKLKFTWAPSFLNGLGNQVGAFGFGVDNGLGHLDLGQFDHWQAVPSVCFAAALVPRTAWEQAGPLDAGFPMYYEDSEWSYRARLMGLHLAAAPQAVIYHAYSGRVPTGSESDLAPRKLQHVIFGRLRFIAKILKPLTLLRFLLSYAGEDLARQAAYLGRANRASLGAYWRAWGGFLRSLPQLAGLRRAIQSRRVVSDRELFRLQRQPLEPYIWRGLPELTWDLVQNHYLPLILAGQTRALPEFSPEGCPPEPDQALAPWSALQRLQFIQQVEGPAMLAHRLWRWLQRRLARP